jgi:hypothetical protein
MKTLLLAMVIGLLVSGCTAIGTSIPKRVFDPITMVPGEWPY